MTTLLIGTFLDVSVSGKVLNQCIRTSRSTILHESACSQVQKAAQSQITPTSTIREHTTDDGTNTGTDGTSRSHNPLKQGGTIQFY